MSFFNFLILLAFLILGIVTGHTKTYGVSAISPYHNGKRIYMVVEEERIKYLSTNQSEYKEKFKDLPLLKTRDFIFPGMINLHSHMQYHVLGLWNGAKGQFNNRFEWRKDKNYKAYVSHQMRAFRDEKGRPDLCNNIKWAEFKEMTVGTTAILGGGRTSSCALNWGIMNLDFLGAELGTNIKIDVATDIVSMNFVEMIYKPYMKDLADNGATFEEAFTFYLEKSGVQDFINDFLLAPKDIESALKLIIDSEILNQAVDQKLEYPFNEKGKLAAEDKIQLINEIKTILKDFDHGVRIWDLNRAAKDIVKFVESFLKAKPTKRNGLRLFSNNGNFRYHYSVRGFLFKDQNKRNNFLNKGKTGEYSYVVHLAEGKPEDQFTAEEFPIAKWMGYANRGLVIIHGLGLDDKALDLSKGKNIPFVWSPVSNLLLYNQTIDLKKFVEKGIQISLAPDWSPSGTKNMLDELKVAKKLFKSQGVKITDRQLVDMAISNPAKAVNLDNDMGSLDVGKLANFFLLGKNPLVPQGYFQNGFTRLINSSQRNIALVVGKGKPLYGRKRTLNKLVSNRDAPFRDALEAIKIQKSSICSGRHYYVQPIGWTDNPNFLKDAIQNKLDQFALDTASKEAELKREVIDEAYSCDDIAYKKSIKRLMETTLRKSSF